MAAPLHVGVAGGGSFAAFASLIADSESLRGPSRSAADVARSVSDSVQQLRVRMHKQKGQALQTARRQAAAAQQAQRKKRTPPWLIDALPADPQQHQHQPQCARPWPADDRQQLSALLRSGDPSVCKCAPARRRAALEESPGACCCLTRLVHVSQALDRPLADVAQRLQLHANLGPFEPALPVDPTPAAEPASHSSADEIADRWAAHLHDDSLVGASQLDWTLGRGPAPAALSARPHMPWSEARVHQLMELVRDQRVRLLERVRRARLADADAAAAAGDEAAEESQLDEPEPDLMTSDWAVVAAQLQPPAHPDTARARYFAAVESGGAVVPADCATHPPLYFPTRERYERQLFFDRSTAAQRRRDDADDEAERAEGGEAPRDGAEDGHDSDADGDGGSLARSDDEGHGPPPRRAKRNRSKTAATHHAPSSADVLRAVRRSVGSASLLHPRPRPCLHPPLTQLRLSLMPFLPVFPTACPNDTEHEPAVASHAQLQIATFAFSPHP